jgi:predicted PurR-regulated permease PerM
VERTRLINLLLILLIALAALFLAQMLWQVASGYADVILLFVLGWLVSFVLNPVVHRLSQPPLNFSRSLSVALVYLGLVLASVIGVALIAPTLIVQLTEIARRMPGYAAQMPPAVEWTQNQLDQLGVHTNVEDAVRAGAAMLQGYAATIVQNALGVLTGLLGFLANLFLVLILGFYFTHDAPLLRQILLRFVPSNFQDEFHVFSENVERTFGGFIRGQLIQAILIGSGTALVMVALQLNFALVASLFAGVFMLIPLVGPFLALLPPLLVALIQTPGVALWVLLALFIYQFAITNVVMPRVLSSAVGMHPLLVLGALLVSVKVAGFWGAFFGIPVVGVLWAMFNYFFERWRGNQSETIK